MIAICHIRQEPHYRRDAFMNGLRKAGYSIVTSGKPAGPEDLFVIWNKYGQYEAMSRTWDAHSGTTIVVENGYIGKDVNAHQLYAISAREHNGAGWWVQTGEDKFSRLGIEVKPWVESTPASHLLICGQRGIGSKLMASPSNWHYNTQNIVKKVTRRPIRVRLHPGNQPAQTKLEEDLAGAHACLIWSSGSGVKALTAGYPVFYDAPHWICSVAGDQIRRKGVDFEKPNRDDKLREIALHRMAEAQWTLAEIESGEPFDRFRQTILSGRIPA